MEAKKINPEFEPLEQGEKTLNHFHEIKKEVEAKQNSFPIDVFPKAIQEIIMSTNESLNFPNDFIGASILYAASVSIGNTHKIEIKKGWEETAVLYLSIVGRPGTNKSAPVSFALKPIEQRDNLKFQRYQTDKREYDKVSALNKKEREEQGYEEPVVPIWEQRLVTDFTPEGLIDVHKYNERGIGVYVDELATWFKNFDRYSKGSEQEFWLSNWSGKAVRTNRKTTEATYINKPFISVIGTIQPAVLNQLADNRTDNGFLDRLLFVAPENLKKQYWSEKELDPVIFENWNSIISSLLDLSTIYDEVDDPEPEVLKFTSEAKQLLFQWQRKLTDESNELENEAIVSMNAKIEMYAVRLSLIIQMLRFACREDDKQAVGIEAMQGALKLVKYFKRTAVKVHSIVNDTNPVDKLPTDKRNFYNQLPETFTTSEGLKFAESFGMAERTFKYFIKHKELFKNLKRGEYEKQF